MTEDAAPLTTPITLTRDLLMSDALRQLRESVTDYDFWSDQQLADSLDATLAARREPAGDVWLFGYGSLIWNPAFHYAERHVGRVHGWHRRFCLWTSLGRGSPDTPGLVLGLEAGGSCMGMAFRLPAETVRAELGIVWRREMLSGAYIPRWVKVHGPAIGTVQAITFTINRRYPRYAGRLDDERVARVLANASGYLGRCADYFFSTIHALEDLGVRDPQLLALYDRVIALSAERDRLSQKPACGGS